MSNDLQTLRGQLLTDPWRVDHPFPVDINDANDVLLDLFSSDSEKEVAIREWLKDHEAQPCVFGKIAGSKAGMDFCFITARDIDTSDEHVAAKIAAARRFWKQRAFSALPKHGFMLVICDTAVANAVPDERLYRFSLLVQRLAGWEAKPESRSNDLVQESVFLRNPNTGKAAKFTFSVDYFASAADQRWWHDHRTPGGLAFTANSLGHMAKYQQWYGKMGERTEWALRTAMNTINSAATDHPYCPATYLLELKDGKPAREFTWNGPKPLPPAKSYEGKDCGSYAGYLHTDHAIRSEFFQPDPCPMHYKDPYLMDFTYIFDTSEADNLTFMVGEDANSEEVEAELGPLGDLHAVAAVGPAGPGPRPVVAGDRINNALNRLRSRAMSEEEIDRLLE